MNVPIVSEFMSFAEELDRRARLGTGWDSYVLWKWNRDVASQTLIERFDTLLSPRTLPHIQPLPHQIRVAQQVLFKLGGRAILADEVGLGKTIEAGLILKEYLLRGLVRRALILVPASLVLQWVRELNEKFAIPAVAQRRQHNWQQAIVVASIDTAKRPQHAATLLETEYDLVLIDEAHKVKNAKSSNYQFVAKLHKKYCLLLTATPLQNNVKELENLVQLLRPGHQDGHEQLMIRHRRREEYSTLVERTVHAVPLVLSREEKALYDSLDLLHVHLQSALALVTLQREVCSSRDAVFVTLVNFFKKSEETSPLRPLIWDLVERIRAIETNSKAAKALQLIQYGGDADKWLIFTEYRATQQSLLAYLERHGIRAVAFSGNMSRGKRDWMMELFRNRTQVLVATGAGGEGINLQFCHNVINYDLPWNPMKIEQRIGRVHRLGQTHPVSVYNLMTRGTIEEHVVQLLMEKLDIFKSTIGEVDPILEAVE